ncbi:NUDIX domain-containing protein [Candidatus Woesearchaeota archaeon]|jgi:isopentenyldiphosphate isomerase|nr:NUDIX domain-containing protein [Candidatus Woesearchaeota archaeon]MBT4111213.1 NUDIX domain-containing protein [Candidatus Woesearchaeota archaeon]MBT4336793.1 NUDIX domain-containing protein [Candidatus Woesearchaeota archaeon]MBT4469461.1 NUDIX domain-containing protein [Candidatus Woesearchaeota archaeon]MBT6744144.1 NUDIX domain-containing protein [Candidatus Woesearchaeota archaeon]
MNENDLLDVVNETDEVIGQDYKNNKFTKGFISRNAVVFIKDKEGRYIIVKRSPLKRTDPNKLDLSVCGNVNAGEDYKQAAIREMKEEIGIECDVKFLKKITNEIPHKDTILKFFTGIFLGEHHGEIVTNEEVKEHQRWTLEELKQEMEQNPEQFTFGFRKDFEEVKDLLQ